MNNRVQKVSSLLPQLSDDLIVSLLSERGCVGSLLVGFTLLLESLSDLSRALGDLLLHESELAAVLLLVGSAQAFETLLHVLADLGDDVLAVDDGLLLASIVLLAALLLQFFLRELLLLSREELKTVLSSQELSLELAVFPFHLFQLGLLLLLKLFLVKAHVESILSSDLLKHFLDQVVGQVLLKDLLLLFEVHLVHFSDRLGFSVHRAGSDLAHLACLSSDEVILSLVVHCGELLLNVLLPCLELFHLLGIVSSRNKSVDTPDPVSAVLLEHLLFGYFFL